jgi:S-(hydroxymethyl)glutathione dehydrogenase/alcohol dehydrogenase
MGRGLHQRWLSGAAPQPIECLAAIAWEPKKEYWKNALSVEKVIVDPPAHGEIRLKLTHTALCHTDAFTLSGEDPVRIFARSFFRFTID